MNKSQKQSDKCQFNIYCNTSTVALAKRLAKRHGLSVGGLFTNAILREEKALEEYSVRKVCLNT